MMTQREKLIELLDMNYGYIAEMQADSLADYLIANGVTIDAVPVVHGRWIYDHWCEFKCSNCGYWLDSKPYKGRENYCPNCGVKMDLEEDF